MTFELIVKITLTILTIFFSFITFYTLCRICKKCEIIAFKDPILLLTGDFDGFEDKYS